MVDTVAPVGSVYIPPKPIKLKPLPTWPQLVWRKAWSKGGGARAEMWYQQFEFQATLAQHEMKPGEETLSLRELARRYPPPAGYKEWKDG